MLPAQPWPPTPGRASRSYCAPASRRYWYETLADCTLRLATDRLPAVALLVQLPLDHHAVRGGTRTGLRGPRLLRYPVERRQSRFALADSLTGGLGAGAHNVSGRLPAYQYPVHAQFRVADAEEHVPAHSAPARGPRPARLARRGDQSLPRRCRR